MDEHPGSQRIPLTLNKYLYGNADPVNHIDPSGNFGLVSVSMGGNIQASLGSIQADFGFNILGGILDGSGLDNARSAQWMIALASMGPSGIKLATILSKGAANVLKKNASRVIPRNPQTIALGLGEYLDDFTHVVNGVNWKHWAKEDPLNWKRAFNEVVSDPRNKVAFNLTGVDSPYAAVQRAASGRGGATIGS